MRRGQLKDYNLMEYPHEIEQLSAELWRCAHCGKKGTLDESLGHVVKTQQDVRDLR